METIIDNAVFLREKYARMDFVTIENVPHIKGLIEAEVTKRIIEESGCGFILDISHAYEAAKNLGTDFYTFLLSLPLEKTYEIHLNGWIEKDGGFMPHTKTNETAYKALEFVLGRCSPKIITVEYGRGNDRLGAGIPVVSPDSMNERAMDEIEEQIARVREIIGK